MNDFVELKKVLFTAVRWWKLLLVVLMASVALGYLISSRQTPIYEASVTLLVGQSTQSTEIDTRAIETSERLAHTYANMVRLQPVLQTVIETLNLDEDWQTLKKGVRAAPVNNTELLRITVETKSPEAAQSIANEIAETLILLSPTTVQPEGQSENDRFILQRLELLRTDIREGQEKLDELESVMSNATARQVTLIQDEINATESLIISQENNYTQLLALVKQESSPNHLSIVEPAQVNSTPIRPRVGLNMFVIGLVGLALALAVIFLLEYLDDTIKLADDLEQALGLTTLGAIGHIQAKPNENKLITARKSQTPTLQAYQILQSNIQFMYLDQVPKSFVVTSPNPGEGKSTTVANLGVTMAHAGFRTIVVDANLRAPVLHQIFQVSKTGGVLDYLQWPKAEIQQFLRNTKVANLQVITSGIAPIGNLNGITAYNPSQLLISPRIKQMVTDLCALADVVIFDSPSVLGSADTSMLSNQVDGVVMIVKAGKTRMGTAKQAVSSLQRIGANLFGVVLNQPSTTNLNYSHSPRSKKGRYVTQNAAADTGETIHQVRGYKDLSVQK